MLAISSGLIVDKISPPSRPPSRAISDVCADKPFDKGIPSNTIRGWLLPNIDVCPRRMIFDEPPPAPDELGVIVRPAILPCNELMKFDSFARVNSLPPTCCVA